MWKIRQILKRDFIKLCVLLKGVWYHCIKTELKQTFKQRKPLLSLSLSLVYFYLFFIVSFYHCLLKITVRTIMQIIGKYIILLCCRIFLGFFLWWDNTFLICIHVWKKGLFMDQMGRGHSYMKDKHLQSLYGKTS